MSTPTWITLANSNQYNQVNQGAALTTFTGPNWISPGGSVVGQAYQTNPAQLYPGQMWRFTANGIWSSTGSPALGLGIYYGTGSPICWASVGAGSTPANAASVPWVLTAMARVTAVGANVCGWNAIGQLAGIYQPTVGGSPVPGAVFPMPPYTSVAQYDSSTAQLMGLVASCGVSSASNAITVYNWAIEYMTEP